MNRLNNPAEAVKDSIISLIKENTSFAAQINEESNLYLNLSFDSLSFIMLLMKIEETYSISFDITQMERCLNVGALIEIVENKIKERADFDS